MISGVLKLFKVPNIQLVRTKHELELTVLTKKIAIFDHLNLKKHHVEIDGIRYPRDSVLVNYEQNDYIEQYNDLKLFFKEYISEEVMYPFISYTDIKTKYPIEIIDLRHQSDH